MPSPWRMLAYVNAIEEKHHVGVSVNLVQHAFNTKKFSGCRYGLVVKKKDEPLILNLDVVNDRGWKNSLGERGVSTRSGMEKVFLTFTLILSPSFLS